MRRYLDSIVPSSKGVSFFGARPHSRDQRMALSAHPMAHGRRSERDQIIRVVGPVGDLIS